MISEFGCLIPRLLSGAFDVTRHRAVWPSTGNYCRGGVAIARPLECRSVVVLPEGMSRSRKPPALFSTASSPAKRMAAASRALVQPDTREIRT